MESITFLLVILISTTFLVPYLLIEEKETRTLDALLVSPASVTQVVVGKALAGAGYGAAAALAMLSLSSRMVVHWEMAIAALACGIAFGVGLGLLLGISFETVQNMSLWMGLLAMVLLIPAVLGAFASPDWPPLVATILGWAPTSLLARAYRAAFWGSVPPDAGLWLLVVVAASVPLYALAIAKLRARDR